MPRGDDALVRKLPALEHSGNAATREMPHPGTMWWSAVRSFWLVSSVAGVAADGTSGADFKLLQALLHTERRVRRFLKLRIFGLQ